MDKSNEKIALKVSRDTIIANLFLTIIQLIIGIYAQSAAVISSAIHTLSDTLTTFIVIVGVKISNKKPDKEHPYGHERFECITAIILAVILGLTGIGIGYSGLRVILAGNYDSISIPGISALVVAGITIIIKEGMYWYKRAAAIKTNSSSLMADAWHHRSDVLASIGCFVGVFGARIGFPVMDSLASLIICLFIVKVAWDIFMLAINQMTDKAIEDEAVNKIYAIILEHEEIKSIDLLKTRQFGNKIYIDIEISVDGNITLNESHDIAHQVHDRVKEEFENVKHCMIHVNPHNN